MARATRSAKRKRPADDVDNDDDDNNNNLPPHKLSRSIDDDDNDVLNLSPNIAPNLAVPIAPHHAAAILDILNMIDSHGLLDRVFPVHDIPGRSTSLRTLLAESQPLPVLRAAVGHLQPISSLPRATPSTTVAQQTRFCTLAMDLLNQASQHIAPLPHSLDDILLTEPPNKHRRLKYALVQHLPNQDYWTSLNNDADLADALTTLPTAHAELVAILPTPASHSDKYPVPTLASYASTSNLQSIKPLPKQRTVTTGSFLDFGPWASFAPTFDHDGEVVGRNELALVLYASHERRTATREPCGSVQEAPIDKRESVDLEKELHELFPPEEAAAVKSALDTLELEKAAQELLDRNRRALMRLEYLQVERIINDGDRSVVEEGSEEWDTAQGILETLTILASLRPQTSRGGARTIIPPPSILHKLHRTLGTCPSIGWHGTLAATRTGALSDDTTFKKSSRAVAPPPAATPTPAPTTTTTTAASAAPVAVTAPVALAPYSGYTYAYGQQGQTQPYRPAGTSTTTGATTGTNGYTQYAPQYYAYTPQQQGQPQNYYTGQQQGYTAASYSTWYSNLYTAQQQQQQQQQQASGSGKNTPQPQMQVQPGTYGSFFGTTAGRTPAVANTVYATAAAAAALPPHLRGATPGVQQGYYTQPK